MDSGLRQTLALGVSSNILAGGLVAFSVSLGHVTLQPVDATTLAAVSLLLAASGWWSPHKWLAIALGAGFWLLYAGLLAWYGEETCFGCDIDAFRLTLWFAVLPATASLLVAAGAGCKSLWERRKAVPSQT